MPQELNPQVDVGALSIQGVTAIAPLLNALSADNVTSTAVARLDKLGALFRMNGKFAAEVPSLLQRYASSRVDRFGYLIGWRKGDTASIMSGSAGGQVVSLMCLCLTNTCRYNDVGQALYSLSQSILPSSIPAASPRQLSDVAELLAAKLQALGFGNFIAQQAVKLFDKYETLGVEPPTDLLQPFTTEFLVDLYTGMSRALMSPDVVLRISGTCAMGLIVATVLALCPNNVEITVEGFTVHVGSEVSVFLMISKSTNSSSSTTINIEERLRKIVGARMPIETRTTQKYTVAISPRFNWAGHAADALRLSFLDMGVQCSDHVIQACCDYVLNSIASFEHVNTRSDCHSLPSHSITGILGLNPVQHIYQVCRTVFGAVPSQRVMDKEAAYHNLVEAVETVLALRTQCSCAKNRDCFGPREWSRIMQTLRPSKIWRCHRGVLWTSVALALWRGYISLFVKAEDRAAVSLEADAFERLEHRISSQDRSRSAIKSCEELHSKVFAFLGYSTTTGVDAVMAASNGLNTIISSSLLDLRIHYQTGYKYRLCDGGLFFNDGRCHRLESTICNGRLAAADLSARNIQAMNYGIPSQISFTASKNDSIFSILTTISCQGYTTHATLGRTIIGSMGVTPAEPCDHDTSSLLDSVYRKDIVATSVARPRANGAKIAIVQTRGDPEAQLFACGEYTRPLLQLNCCLNCAVRQALDKGLDQIIMGLPS